MPGGCLIAAVIVLTVVIVKARKSLLESPTDSGPVGFTLGDLRLMHRRGELSDEEYNRAKDVLIQQVRGSDHAGQEGEAAGNLPAKDDFDPSDRETHGDSEAMRR